MSDDKLVVGLEKRDVLRKGLAGLRKQGSVPGVIHKPGKPSVHVTANELEMLKAYAKAGKRQPVYLDMGGKNQLAIIKDVDFEPSKHKMRHVVFQSIKQNEKVTAEIPVVLVGEEIPAQKAGHMILPQLDMVKVEALPSDLPEKFEVDATKLAEVGDRLSVADLTVPSGVTILTEPEQSLAVVEMPKDQLAALAEEEEKAKAEAAAAGEGEKSEESESDQKAESEQSSEETSDKDAEKSDEKES